MSRGRQVLVQALLVLVWLLLWRMAIVLEYAPHASLWFPPAGLSFAAFLVLGLRATPAIFVSAVLATFWMEALHQSGDPLDMLLRTSLYFGVVHCLAYGLGAWLLKALVRRAPDEALPLIILVFLVLAALSSLIAAVLGAQALALSGTVSTGQASTLWLPWWIGDMTAVVTLTPIFLAGVSWFHPRVEAWLGGLNFHVSRAPLGQFLFKLVVLVSLLAASMLLTSTSKRPEVAFTVFFLIIAQMWVVYTETALRAAISLSVFCFSVALGVSALELLDQALVYQFAVMVIAASSHLGLAVPILVNRNRLLREQAITDGLTRVATRRFFFEQASYLLLKYRRAREPVSLMIFDLDHFKRINDQEGHIVGDKALLVVAQIVRRQLRHNDLMGRFGGDEFMLLLPGCALEDARQLAERMRGAIQRLEVAGIEQPLSATFAAVEISEDESLMAAFGRADEHLMAGKRGGRNRLGQTEQPPDTAPDTDA